ncbi:MAG: complex I subunit 5 family protein [Wenzhouxiangella sp.]
MMTEALAGLVFLPLLAACAVLALPSRSGRVPATAIVVLSLVGPLVLLLPITVALWTKGAFSLQLAGFDRPLGIVWRVDALALLLLWLHAIVGALVGVQALASHPTATDRGRRFWPLWLLLAAGMNALLLSADLFNLYVTLELVTLAAIGLIAIDGKPAALKAAMRYLLLALMASLLYLLGVGLIYGQTGTLDLYQAGQTLDPALLPITALVLMLTGLLVKSAIFPLHIWLPGAHGNAPGPVSAILSAMVVKVSIYIIWRLWFWMAPAWELMTAANLLGVLGAVAIFYGSILALSQKRLKMIIAYSTVAQLGYLMLVFPLASVVAFQGAVYHLLSHGLAKAAMFMAAANILLSLGTDNIKRLAGLDQRLPMDVFTLALAGVSIMGLPPSGGFLGKWLLLTAAWQQDGWAWMVVIVAGGLLSAAYIFRILAVTCFHPKTPGHNRGVKALPPAPASIAALALALMAIIAGFASAPILGLLEAGLPPGMP